MDLIQLRYFIKVYEEKKIATAAEHLYVSQQYLSKVIQKIEKELGVTLFERTSKGMIATLEGERAYRHFRAMLMEYSALQEELSHEQQNRRCGRVRVVLDVGLVQLLTSRPMLGFSKRYPEIELILEEHRVFNCKRMVLQGKADLGLSLCLTLDSSLAYHPICQIGAEVLVASDHPLSRKACVTVDDLLHEKLLFQSCPPYYIFLEEFERGANRPQILLAVNEESTVLDYVKKGMGVCPMVIRPTRGAPRYPRGITAVPYQSTSPILLCGYIDPNRKDNPELQLVLDYLTGYFS